MSADSTPHLVPQIGERGISRIERQPCRDESLREIRVSRLQRVARLLGKGPGQPRVAQQSVLRIDPANGGECRADVRHALYIEQHAMFEVFVEAVTQTLDLIVLARAEPILQILHGKRVRQKCLQLSEQHPRPGIVRSRLTGLGGHLDTALERLDEARTRALIE